MSTDGSPPPEPTSRGSREDSDDEVRRREQEQAAEADRAVHRTTGDEPLVQRLVDALTGPNVLVTVLAFVLALVIGAVLIAVSDSEARGALSYVFARPGDFFGAAWTAISASYGALVKGAVGSTNGITESLLAATPLILTGLAVALPFRAGLFNIGGEGQVIVGGMVAAWAGFAIDGLPLLVHLPLALLLGVVAGGLMGWLPGFLKVRTGAHEVITTIMLNNIAAIGLSYGLTSELFLGPDNINPRGLSVADSATLPRLFGTRLNVGIIIALVVAVGMYYLMERSSRGFEIEAVGLNPHAASSAGMSVARATIATLAGAGALAGLGGAILGLGVASGGITTGFSAGVGFDGITVALLGRARVPGTVAAGLLFGALSIGGRAMQARAGINLDLVGVLSALIILFVAAPALVQALFRLKRHRTVDVPGMSAQGAA